MLDVDAGPALGGRDEVQSRELRSHRAVGSPAPDSLARIVQVAIVVQVFGEPDIVITAAIPVLDDVDIAVIIDREIRSSDILILTISSLQ